MPNAIETALTALGVVYTDVEADILPWLHSKLFDASMDVVGIRLTIPDNTTNPYHLFVPPDEVHIAKILNASYDRVYEDDFDYATTSAYTSITPSSEEDYTMYKHGDGFLFETEDEARNVDLECLITNKTAANLDDELRLILLYAYYYAYVGDMDRLYNYIRRISNIKKNTVNQRHVVVDTRKLPMGNIVPREL